LFRNSIAIDSPSCVKYALKLIAANGGYCLKLCFVAEGGAVA